mmetsp:Transcript_51171/g.111082  ORF Transcript_51171/g.111082 Transcript_51171/m.111082 type:complete len:206 (+) Transcript_51171:114-731(+)
MTKSPAFLAFAMRSFCAKGSRSSSSSTPRSPRATISASDFSMMPSMLVSAWGFSIFGQILGRLSRGTSSLSMISMSSCRSWAFCAKETQMYSIGGSSWRRYSASSISFVVRAAQSISTSGTLTPFLAFSLPPCLTCTTSSVSDFFSSTVTVIRPSSIRRLIPGFAALMRASCSIVGFMVIRPGLIRSCSSLQMPNSRVSPSFKSM